MEPQDIRITSQEFVSSSYKESIAASSSGLMLHRPAERVVTIGRGTTIECPSSSLPVGRHVAGPATKKQRVDDILSHVKEARVEKDQDSSRKTRMRYHTCWVPGCEKPNRYIKAHAFKVHIPGIFTESLPSSDLQVLRGRKKALLQAARWLLNRPATLGELSRFINIQRMLVVADNSSISTVQRTAMVDMCKFLQCPVPSDFTLVPASSTSVLIHWKAILLIAASLDEEERRYWRDSFPEPGKVERQEPVRNQQGLFLRPSIAISI